LRGRWRGASEYLGWAGPLHYVPDYNSKLAKLELKV